MVSLPIVSIAEICLRVNAWALYRLNGFVAVNYTEVVCAAELALGVLIRLLIVVLDLWLCKRGQ